METKICTKCGRELPVEDFPFRNKAKGIRRSNCKKCHNHEFKVRPVDFLYKDNRCPNCKNSRGEERS